MPKALFIAVCRHWMGVIVLVCAFCLAPTAQAQSRSVKDCDVCPVLVRIPAGSFMMGSDDVRDNAGPRHPVAVKAFWMGRTEVTQAQWKAIMGSNPSQFNRCGGNCPVDRVSWEDAQEYVKRLSRKTGKNYRLPTEAEWEYACRASGQERFCGSHNVDAVAWYNDNSGLRTHRVARKRANAWRLYDMSGNVCEWVQDTWHRDYEGAPADGSARNSGGDTAIKVHRGGGWPDHAYLGGAVERDKAPRTERLSAYGLRVARAP